MMTPLFPSNPGKYNGPRAAFVFFIIITLASTVRSLIHILAPDGGAASIAGIEINLAGGQNIVAMFAQWGASQLVLAIVYWVIILRYPGFTPLGLLLVIIEQVLRIWAGMTKELEVVAAPPGAIGTRLLLPLAIIALVLSLWGRKK
jgi:hypothetical protein